MPQYIEDALEDKFGTGLKYYRFNPLGTRMSRRGFFSGLVAAAVSIGAPTLLFEEILVPDCGGAGYTGVIFCLGGARMEFRDGLLVRLDK